MQIFGIRGVGLLSILFLVIVFSEQPATGHHALILAIPALLLKAGLAAPIVLAVVVKLLLLLGLKLKLKALVLPKLLLAGKLKSVVTDNSKEILGGSSYGRKKRSLDLVESLIGEIPIDENQLLEAILKVDTRRCGERLLCEVAGHQINNLADDDEKAIVSLFTMKEEGAGVGNGLARRIYSNALLQGFQGRSCAVQYPTCPYSREQMMGIVHAIADEPVQ